MKEIVCAGCGKAAPMGQMLAGGGKAFCDECAPQAGATDKLLDPTVCARCGKDEGSRELERVAGIPVCPDCEAALRDYPFPVWVKGAFVVVVVLAVFSFLWNWRFLKGYLEMLGAARAAEVGDLVEAEELMASASSRVPESDDLATSAALYRGLRLLREDKCSEAVPVLRGLLGKGPDEASLTQFLLHAEAGAAFEAKDYDGFLNKSMDLLALDPRSPTAIGQVASAYACKYAATGDEKLKTTAEKYLDQARQAAGPGDAHFQEYEERILHRLKTREIISKKEYDGRFRGGAAGKEENR
ncbi:MAG: hypothetical protein HY721_31505 [Planctomycetes bacterium]|nr:hypothetical protein [Planctomycetota bacterium]